MKTHSAKLVGALLLALSMALALVVVPAPAASAAANNNEIAYKYFVKKGLTGQQSAGVIGNLIQESGSPINPRADQANGPGKGIAQWSEGGRWDDLIAYAKSRRADRYSLELQLDFIWFELSTYSWNGLADLRAARNVPDATTAFMKKFERCGQCELDKRLRYAADIFAAYGGGARPAVVVETKIPTLRVGNKGEAVRTLQYNLRARGYKVTVDGAFGNGTKKAVLGFQRSKGWKSSGAAGPKTWNALLPTLTKGSKGDAVKALQRELSKEGYRIAVNGSFDAGTKSTVISYQKASGLKADGIVRRDTWGSLID